VKLFRPGKGIPQNVTFPCGRSEDLEALLSFLRRLTIERVEFADLAALGPPLHRAFRSLGRPYDVWLCDVSLVWPSVEPRPVTAEQAGSPKRRRSPSAIPQRPAGAHQQAALIAWRESSHDLLRSARRITVPSPELAALLRRADIKARLVPEPHRGEPTGERDPVSRAAGNRLLGVIALDASAPTLGFLVDLARALRICAKDLDLVVLGATFDDLQLLATGNCFVTGPVGSDQLNPLLETIQPSHLLLMNREGVFGHPLETEAVESAIPLARFDWLIEKPVAFSKGGLLISPAAGASELASALVSWMQKAPAEAVAG
jgi:hypothetical protein